jgi:uncharacterized protein YaaQ
MKMIIAIVDDSICNNISQSLLGANYRVTQLATTGGFLRGGATTLMIGVEDDLVNEALQTIRDGVTGTADVQKNQATLYVLNVKSSNRI